MNVSRNLTRRLKFDSSGVYVNFGSSLEFSETYLVILSHSRNNITYDIRFL